MAEITGCLYQACLQIEDVEETVFSLDPGENCMQKHICQDKQFDILAFPDLFPSGSGSYSTVEEKNKVGFK